MNGTRDGDLSVSPALLSLARDVLQTFEIGTKNGNGLNVSAPVQLALPKSFEGCFVFADALSGTPIDWTVDGDRIVAGCETNRWGQLALTASLKSSEVPASPRLLLTLSASLGGSQPVEMSVPIQVICVPPPASA